MKLVDVIHFKIIQMYVNKNSFTRCLRISLHYIVAIMYIRYTILLYVWYMDVRRCVCIWWVDYSGVVSYGWAGIRLAGLLTVRQSLGLFLPFSVYYGTLNVLFFRLFLDDSLMCILFLLKSFIVYGVFQSMTTRVRSMPRLLSHKLYRRNIRKFVNI